MPLDQQTFAKCKIVKAVANRGHQPSPFPEFDDNLNSRNMDKAYDCHFGMAALSPNPADLA